MLHGCIDDEGTRRMAEGEEDMDKRSGILCTFSGGWCLRFSFLRKSKIIVSAWYKKQEGKETERGEGRKTDCWARAYPGPVSRVDREVFCTRMGGLFVCYTMGRHKKRLLRMHRGRGLAMQIGIMPCIHDHTSFL
jgi:hypothetical protein